MTSLTLKTLSADAVAEVVSSAGLDGIEWGVGDNHVILGDKKRADEIKKASNKYGLEIFSLGSYCYLNDKGDCEQTVETAKLLSAPVIRVWGGKFGSAECPKDAYDSLIKHARYMADKAADSNITIGFEYHQRSLTDTAESAVKLIKDIDRDNVKLYWQPNYSISFEENLREFNTVKPYLCSNLHFHNYSPEHGYMPLDDIKENIKGYFSDVKSQNYNLMIEFVKDSTEENLRADAATLNKILR